MENFDMEYLIDTAAEGEYHYQPGDVWQEQTDLSNLNWEIFDFSIKYLAPDCLLAMYKAFKPGESDAGRKYSLRSSIWKCYEGTWKVVFHQGTLSKMFG